MNEKKKLQPKVRFREFTGENAPDWEQRKAKEIFITISEKGYIDLPVLSASQEFGMVERNNIGIDIKYDLNSIKNYKRVLPKQFVIHLRSFQGGFAWSTIEGITSPAYTVIDFIEKCNQDFGFWKISLTSTNFIKKLETVTYGIRDGRSISFKDFSSMNFLIPNINEQKRIGKLFEKLDKLITLHQRKLEQLEQLKNTLLSKMFPKSGTNIPEIRFSGFTDAWKQRKLGEMSTSFSGGTPTVGVREYYNGEIPFIRSAEIGKCKTELYISKLGLDNSSARLVSKGDILYAMYGATSGEVARSQIDGAINQAILVIKPVQSVDSEYITQWLRKNKQKIIKTFLQGGQGNLSASIIKNLKVYFPTIEEQQKIGNVFNSFDRSLKFHLNRINELKCLKNNLLNKMFI